MYWKIKQINKYVDISFLTMAEESYKYGMRESEKEPL